MTRQSPRRPSSSRTPVSRPRRVAGQGSASAEPVEAAETPAVPPTGPPDEPPAPPTEPSGPPDPSEEDLDEPVEGEPDTLQPAPEVVAGSGGLTSLFDSRRATTILVSLVVVLALAAGGLFIWNAVSSEDEAKPSKQPVVISGDDATDAVAAAAKSAETIVATSYEDYDDQVDEATALMTAAFAKEYRQNAEDIKPDFVAAKTDIQVRVVGQGVVHATRTEVQALLFLNQYVSKDGGDTTYTPYRVLVTVINTDRGWLVSNLDTK